MTSINPLRTLLVGVLGAGLVLVGAPAEATHGDLPPGRRIVDHTVRPGETATELAVRFHAWTAELIRHNHLGRSATIRVGQHLEIPVVRSAVPQRGRQHRQHDHRRHRHAQHGQHETHQPAAHLDPGRAQVRRVVARTARHHGVDPQLALAVSWQESGWRMGVRSSAGAIGAMQVLPTTGAWMSLYAGHRLRLHRLRGNAIAGVTLLRVLDAETANRRRAVGAYYQGLGAVRSHGLYDETRHYVRNVLAIKHRLEAGRSPA